MQLEKGDQFGELILNTPWQKLSRQIAVVLRRRSDVDINPRNLQFTLTGEANAEQLNEYQSSALVNFAQAVDDRVKVHAQIKGRQLLTKTTFLTNKLIRVQISSRIDGANWKGGETGTIDWIFDTKAAVMKSRSEFEVVENMRISGEK